MSYNGEIYVLGFCFFFFFQAEDGIRDLTVTGVQTCALPILVRWTTQRAVAVMPAPTRWIRMTFMVNHPDLTTKPVDVRLRRNTELIFRTRLRSEERRVGKECRSRWETDQ